MKVTDNLPGGPDQDLDDDTVMPGNVEDADQGQADNHEGDDMDEGFNGAEDD